MKDSKNLILVIAFLVVAGASFYGGTLYQKNQSRNFGSQAGLQNGNNSGFNRNSQTGSRNQQGMMGSKMGFRPVNGEIISADDKSITVKLTDGSTKIVLISSNTAVSKASQGSFADLKQGETVAAFGTENSDGSLTATSVQLNPLQRNQGAPNQSAGQAK